MVVMALVCLFPMLNVLAISFSSNRAVQAGEVTILPVDFDTIAYWYLLRNTKFWRSIVQTLKRLAMGGFVNMSLVVLTAYPLSRTLKAFPGRRFYVWFILITMLFGGGLIPTFLVVKFTGLINSLWSLVLPTAVPAFNVILLMNFFRQLPTELEEAAFIDGAGHITNLVRIFLPLSKPALATITLFVLVMHWNEWFHPIIYLLRTELYPLQTYLRTVLIQQDFEVQTLEQLETFNKLSNRTIISAQIFLGMLPILLVYPFLQKYFAKGIVLGSVKG
jgi:putative aldouronate transport system permease protein